MTTHVVTDDVLARYSKREWELRRRLMEGALDPEKVCAGLQQLLESCSWPKFSVWRTITHRGHRNAESYLAGLSSIHCKDNDWANDLLIRLETTSVDEEVDLGCASVAELGFTKATRFDVICDRIVALGHNFCLPEDGPVLREQYLEQPLNECVRLVMKAIRVSGGYPGIFSVEHCGNGLWLYGRCGCPGDLFRPDDRFVFRLRKRPLVA